MEWSWDSKQVVEEIMVEEKPTRWESFHNMVYYKHTFKEKGWKLSWHLRVSNEVADLATKLFLILDTFLSFLT